MAMNFKETIESLFDKFYEDTKQIQDQWETDLAEYNQIIDMQSKIDEMNQTAKKLSSKIKNFDVIIGEDEEFFPKSSSKVDKIKSMKEFVESRQRNFEEDMIEMSQQFLPIFEHHKRFLT